MAQFAKKVKKLATFQFLNFKLLLNGRGFAKFKKNYKLKGELGRGGFGVVYRAVRISDETPVAVKFIKRRQVREWGKLNDEKVPMEICMLAKCTKVNGVVRLYDWYSMPEGFLIIMERPYPCIDMFDFIRTQNQLDENLARFLFRQIVETVVECAQKKVIHRDIKDENIVIDLVTGQTRLIDFGAATILKKTKYTDFQGTRLYCPPEWFLHSLYLGKEAAVWSLGVLLYNMLNGRLPFRNEKDICTSHLLGSLPFYTSISPEAKDLIEKCLRFDPFARYSLEEIMGHPWVLAPTADWLTLSASSAKVPTTNYATDSLVEDLDDDEKTTNISDSPPLSTANLNSIAEDENNVLLKVDGNETTSKIKRMAKTSVLKRHVFGSHCQGYQEKSSLKKQYLKNRSMNQGMTMGCSWVQSAVDSHSAIGKAARKTTMDSGQLSLVYSTVIDNLNDEQQLRSRLVEPAAAC
uniref:non-specific serine/threonine protein kinase n=1 Tax=Syphacia muris TaxID=451379 RepID=A0A0N5AQY7_9BILA